MKKKILALLVLLVPSLGMASGGGFEPFKVDVDLHNKDSLRNGAKYFVNYCMGCHSLKYMMYQRMGDDLGLTKEQVEENLIFTGAKIGDYMTISMPEAQASEWFGTAPPDLTLVTRNRGADWLYTYLLTFYVDDSRPFGVNNLMFKDVRHAHVLWELQGLQKAVFEESTDEHGNKTRHFVRFEKISDGQLSDAEYEKAVRDLVAFLVYAGEPAKLVRYQLGVWVILFLLVLLVVSYALKKEYWKDVH